MKCKVISKPAKSYNNTWYFENYKNKLSELKAVLKKAYIEFMNEEEYRTDKLSIIKANIRQYHSIL